MSRSYLLLWLLVSASLGACAVDGADEEADLDQAVVVPAFRLESVAAPGFLVQPVVAGNGQQVAMLTSSGASKEQWRAVNQQIINVANSSLCLQAAGTSSGSGLIVAPCVDPFGSANPPQFWRLHLKANGTAQWENLVAHGLYLDGSSSHALTIRPFSGLPAQDFKRLF